MVYYYFDVEIKSQLRGEGKVSLYHVKQELRLTKTLDLNTYMAVLALRSEVFWFLPGRS